MSREAWQSVRIHGCGGPPTTLILFQLRRARAHDFVGRAVVLVVRL